MSAVFTMMDKRRRHDQPGWSLATGPTLAVLGSCVVFLGFVFAFSPVPVEQLSLDPNDVGGQPWFVGIVSMLGAVAWTVAVAASVGGSWIAATVGRAGAASMLRGGALLSSLLLVDDLFQIHTLPSPLLGISKSVVLGAYGLLAVWWVASDWREIARTRRWLLLLAASAFALSLLVDQFGAESAGAGGWIVALEDGAKFIGTALWAEYFVLTAADIIRSIVNVGSKTAVGSGINVDAPSSRQQDHEWQGQ